MNRPSPNRPEPLLPALPKGGGAIQGPGLNWLPTGMTGEAALEMPLPISVGRGFDPSLSLSYRSTHGQGPFGLGWAVPAAAISRDTRKGVPAYTDEDAFIDPHGVELIPERDANGALHRHTCDRYNGLALNQTYQVVRYFPVIESRFDRIEHWSNPADRPGFWLIQGADGVVHLLGKTDAARCADPNHRHHVAQWLLQESLNPLGEQIYYHYKPEDQAPPAARDCRAQRYLARVCYGNLVHQAHLALWNSNVLAERQWHFELVFDYGERVTGLSDVPTYGEQQPWPQRSDPHVRYGFGFELGSRRLCRQILMFHYFPDEPGMGADPVLVRRLLLEYTTGPCIGSSLRALHHQAWDGHGAISAWPPLELAYSPFKLLADSARYQPFDTMAGLGDGTPYQLVDLYNDGLPGLLYRRDQSWSYREPMRATPAADTQAVAYGPLQELARIPPGNSAQPARQALTDLGGNGHLAWLVAQPGLSGVFTLDAQRQWSGFTPFAALPQEFFHPYGQLADLMGSGLDDLVLIGSRSVRLYANRQAEGFGPGLDVPHDADALPTLSNSPAELVAFCDLLGSGQQHLVRIRHNEIKCWPNLGRGRFGRGVVFASLPFAYARFDAANVRLADLDGSGAVDLLYLETDRVLIFMNHGGNGLVEPAVTLPWPQGVRHAANCQVSLADVQGLGCSSLILSVPHGTPRHWRYDFISQKPYLLTATVNNKGASTKLSYRSSAQEWLDEKQHWQHQGKAPGSALPFPVQVVKQHQQKDLISGDLLSRHFQYREPCHDSVERAFVGFGLLLDTDGPPDAAGTGLTKRWFHTGQPPRAGYYAGDPEAPDLGPTLLTQREAGHSHDTPIKHPTTLTLRHANRALRGKLLREERYAAADASASAVPYSVRQQRYLVRLLRPSSASGEAPALLPLLLESITCRYERQADDPVCQHTLHLRRDRYGSLEHSVTVDYARRKTVADPPPFNPPHQQQWWRDAHDAAQQAWYFNETRAEAIHLDAPQRWRLQLPYRQRHNVWVLAKDSLQTRHLTYEQFIDDSATNPVGPSAKRQLGGLSVQHYCAADDAAPLPPGSADFQALASHLEVAEFDEQALSAYASGTPSVDIRQALDPHHYRRLPAFLPATPGHNGAMELWSVDQGYVRYANAQGFYRPRRHQASQSHGVTHTEYDAYGLHVTTVKTADGCSTHARHDYRLGLPVLITDAQGTHQYAHYDAFGQLLAMGVEGREHGTAIGGDTRPTWKHARGESPAQAIAAPVTALHDACRACFYDVFSWMGRIPAASLQPQWVRSGYVLPGGQIRASALARLKASGEQPELKALILAARREPVHVAVLQTDRLAGAPGASEKNIQVILAYSDGFGRVVQSQQQAQPGLAFEVDDEGTLMPQQEVEASPRWRVSAPVEYNHQGLAVRTWRPYFAQRAGYLKDHAFKASCPVDLHVHDPLGRPVSSVNANGDTRRQTYWAWYTVAEDENDTHGLPPDA